MYKQQSCLAVYEVSLCRQIENVGTYFHRFASSFFLILLLLREQSLRSDMSDDSLPSDAPGNPSLGSAPSGSPLLYMQQPNSPPSSLKAKHHQPDPVMQECHLHSQMVSIYRVVSLTCVPTP